MADPGFLLVRLGSMGDVIHAIPSASALRETFPGVRIDWLVEPRWERLLRGNPDLNEIITVDRKSAGGIMTTVRKLRAAKYSCAIDFQALYKSALLAFASGAPERIGFQSSYAREGLAAHFYTEQLNPRGAHKVEHNLTLAQAAGARETTVRFPLAVYPADEQRVAGDLAGHKLREFFVLNPGGGWRSKCWPAERYGQLHRVLAQRFGWRGVVTFGPGEENLAREVVQAASDPALVAIALDLGPLMALMRRARFVVSADTGPLHLASALGTPVVGLFGPTDPSRNGPYSADSSVCRDIVIRNPRDCETTYNRGKDYAKSMLSISVQQVADTITQRWGAAA